jgi:hypothetical protein
MQAMAAEVRPAGRPEVLRAGVTGVETSVAVAAGEVRGVEDVAWFGYANAFVNRAQY